MLRVFLIILSCFTLVSYACAGHKGYISDDPSLLCCGAGAYNFTRSNPTHKTALLQLEFKGPAFFQKPYFKIRSFVSALGTFQGTLWAGFGFNFDIHLGSPVVLTLGFGPGLYSQGHGKNLGYPLEMRSSVELAYRFKKKSRLGVQFYHLSNASLGAKNPGTEALVLFYGIPI